MTFLRPDTLLKSALLLVFVGSAVRPALSQTAPQTTSPSSPSAATNGSTTPATHRRSVRARRRYVAPSPAQPIPGAQTVSPTGEQRRRDAQILATQKAQSAEIARQNAITTGNVVREREAQQAEPRIQDAPGPGSAPLAGDPAVQATQTGDAERVQDAPGPAQTLPKAPPAQNTQTAPSAPSSPKETAPRI